METTKAMQDELAKNIKTNEAELISLFKSYEIAKIGYDVQQAEEKEIYNEVLKEHEFFCSREDCTRIGLNFGDRITDEWDSFTLSDEDREQYYKYAIEKFVARGITDKEGNYLEGQNWLCIMVDCERTLANLIIDNVLPASMRKDFAKHRDDVACWEKLIEIVKPAIKG